MLGALERGLRLPPRFTRRSAEQVSRFTLASPGGAEFEISVSPLTDAAEAFRALVPSAYRRLRPNW